MNKADGMIRGKNPYVIVEDNIPSINYGKINSFKNYFGKINSLSTEPKEDLRSMLIPTTGELVLKGETCWPVGSIQRALLTLKLSQVLPDLYITRQSYTEKDTYFFISPESSIIYEVNSKRQSLTSFTVDELNADDWICIYKPELSAQ